MKPPVVYFIEKMWGNLASPEEIKCHYCTTVQIRGLAPWPEGGGLPSRLVSLDAYTTILQQIIEEPERAKEIAEEAIPRKTSP
jgi:hypothetical protein